jgi:hypothetical protein
MDNNILSFVYPRLEGLFAWLVGGGLTAFAGGFFWMYRAVVDLKAGQAASKEVLENFLAQWTESETKVSELEQLTRSNEEVLKALGELAQKQDKRIEWLESEVQVIKQRMVGWDTLKRIELLMTGVSPDVAAARLSQAISHEVRIKEGELKATLEDAQLKNALKKND